MATPGTIEARLDGIADFAIARGLATGLEAKPPELIIMEEVDRLRAEIARLRARPTEEEVAQKVQEQFSKLPGSSGLTDIIEALSVSIARAVLTLFPKVQP